MQYRLIICVIILTGFTIIANGQVTFSGPELLGTPTNNSITINIVPDDDIDLYYEYGTVMGGPYSNSTNTTFATGGEPHEVTITGLSPNTRYYYRMVYRNDGGSTWYNRPEYTFHTNRDINSTFIFTIITDTHASWTSGQYQNAVANIQNDQPDLHLDLGDTFMTDYDGTQSAVNDAYLISRNSLYMGGIGRSAPIFLAAGNHENEEGWNLDDSPFSPALASIQARKLFYPTPVPNGFYSGNEDLLTDINASTYGDQYREDYYAWQWGSALFVVFDPFQYTMTNPYGNTAGEGSVGSNDPASGDRWNWTLGQQQYNWLKETLENSGAKYKFMFAHHMLGGTQNYVREGATPAHQFEWGGYNSNGTAWGWNTNRPGWGNDPIRQIMIDNNVTAFFHGHDHQYAYEVRDDIVYQSIPKPSSGIGFNYYSESDQYTEKVLNNNGYLRVTVSPSDVLVEFVDSNTAAVLHSYSMTNDITLPVTLNSFTADVIDNHIRLEWQTAGEIDNLGFNVYRADSGDGSYLKISGFKTNPDLEGLGNSSIGKEYYFIDNSVKINKTYWYKISDMDYNGNEEFSDTISAKVSDNYPVSARLIHNFPNPFNPTTTIRYSVEATNNSPLHVEISIYNLLGQKVATLVNKEQPPGSYTTKWVADGFTSGTYFYKIKTGDSEQTRKMILLR